MIKLKLCSVLLLFLTACAGTLVNPSKYALAIIAGRSELFFNRRVVYSVDEHGSLLNINLPTPEQIGSSPEWSPDGRWIVHIYRNPTPRSASDNDLYLMSIQDYSKTIRLTNHFKSTSDVIVPQSLSWAPDSTQLAIGAYAPNVQSRYGIYLLDLQCLLTDQNCTPELTLLTPGNYPDWSPDGKRIVYRDAASDEIYVVDLDNPTNQAKISQGLSPCSSPQWSPDGQKIAFGCNETIYTVDPNGQNLMLLTSGAISHIRWISDGKKIAFIGTELLDPNLGKTLNWEGTVSSTAVFIMDPNGTNIERVTMSNDESIGWFEWLPTSSLQSRP